MTYLEIIKKLQKQGIRFSKGLNGDEFAKIEFIYNFKFPKELKAFYSEALPIEQSAKNPYFTFPVWNNFSVENISRIEQWMNEPKKRILDEFKNDGTLLTDLFGCCNIAPFEPKEYENKFSEEQKEKHFYELEKLLSSIEMLIPIFAHRYLVLSDKERQPILSCYGTDIILYGSDLADYLQNEFLGKKLNGIYTSDNINNLAGWKKFVVR